MSSGLAQYQRLDHHKIETDFERLNDKILTLPLQYFLVILGKQLLGVIMEPIIVFFYISVQRLFLEMIKVYYLLQILSF